MTPAEQRRADKAEALSLALTRLKTCSDLAEFLRIADKVDDWSVGIEKNFYAHIIQVQDMAAAAGKVAGQGYIRRQADMGMLQLALLDEGLQVPSPFIMAAYDLGWRVVAGRITLLVPKVEPGKLELTPYEDDDGYSDPLNSNQRT